MMLKCISNMYAGGAVQRSVPQFPGTRTLQAHDMHTRRVGMSSASLPGLGGPHLGVIDTSNTKRDFKRDLGPVSQTGGLHF